MSETKYEAQQKHLRAKWFSLDFKPDMLEAFRTACEKNVTKPTTEIKKFVSEYIESVK